MSRDYKISIFVIAAALSGMSGAMYGSYLGGLAPIRFGLGESIALLVVVTVGGLGSIPGHRRRRDLADSSAGVHAAIRNLSSRPPTLRRSSS